jgi:hypothetical protein
MSSILQAAIKTATGVGLAAAPVASHIPKIAAGIPEPYLVDLCLFVSCMGGAYASFSWGDPVEPRGKFARLFVSCIIMGLAITTLANAIIAYCFDGFALTLEVRAGIGAIVSCLTRFVMPKIIDMIKDGTWRTLIPWLNKDQ